MEHPLDQRRKRQLRKWANPKYALKESSRNRAKTGGIKHTIKMDDIEIPTHCPVFGCLLKAGGQSPESMSLDRIDPLKGYVPGNVKVISLKANRLKNNATIEELEMIVAYMKREKGI